MKNYPGIVLVILCIAAIFGVGCTNQTAPLQTPTPTPVPTPVVPQVMTTPIATPHETTTPASVPVTTLPPPADPSDISEITFLRYSDSDFSVDYPSPWTITHSTYTPYYCKNVLDTSRSDYHVCFENETKTIGPFDFYEDDNIQKPSRIVMFTSADGTLKFVSFTSDFRENMNGYWVLDPSVDWAKNEFELRYPNLSASTYVTNYKYFRSENILTSTFDVRLPENPKYYPEAYTEKSIVTLHHVYTFAFITTKENFDKYRNLKERILSSIKPNDVI